MTAEIEISGKKRCTTTSFTQSNMKQQTSTLPSEPKLYFLAVEVKAVEDFVQARGSRHQENRSYMND